MKISLADLVLAFVVLTSAAAQIAWALDGSLQTIVAQGTLVLAG